MRQIHDRASLGGVKRDRTADLYNAIVALYQLSYDPSVRVSAILGGLRLHVNKKIN